MRFPIQRAPHATQLQHHQNATLAGLTCVVTDLYYLNPNHFSLGTENLDNILIPMGVSADHSDTNVSVQKSNLPCRLRPKRVTRGNPNHYIEVKPLCADIDVSPQGLSIGNRSASSFSLSFQPFQKSSKVDMKSQAPWPANVQTIRSYRNGMVRHGILVISNGTTMRELFSFIRTCISSCDLYISPGTSIDHLNKLKRDFHADNRSSLFSDIFKYLENLIQRKVFQQSQQI